MSGFVSDAAMGLLQADTVQFDSIYGEVDRSSAKFPTLMLNAYFPGESCICDGNMLQGNPLPWSFPTSGANGRLAFVGTTRDEYGSPLGNCTVKVFRTSDDSLQSTVTSDDNGVYSITTPYADSHYLIVYKVGPPDICGTTVNTLAPG